MRLAILTVLYDADAYSDVVREAQEIAELALKGILRQVGVEPPHWHDVGGLLREHASRVPSISAAELDRLAVTSAWLRKEREFSFYGDIDFIPTEQYDATVAMRAIEGARECVAAATRVIVVSIAGHISHERRGRPRAPSRAAAGR